MPLLLDRLVEISEFRSASNQLTWAFFCLKREASNLPIFQKPVDDELNRNALVDIMTALVDVSWRINDALMSRLGNKNR